MANLTRNSSLIDRSIKSTLIAAVLTSVAPVIATLVDGIFVSNLVSQDAFTAISLVMPIVRIVTVMMLICHMGANILASRAIGRGDNEEARGQYTVAMVSSLAIGLLSFIVVFAGCGPLSRALCDDSSVNGLISAYMKIMAVNFPFVAVSSTLNFFISGEGYPDRTSRIVLISSISNIILDFLFICVLRLGISGAAWGTVLSTVINVVLHMPFLLSGKSRYKFVRTGKKTAGILKASLTQGFAFNIINITLNIFLIFANALMEKQLGVGSYFQWAICIQMQMFLICVCSGSVAGAVYLGNTLLGEGDGRGVSFVINRLLVFHVIFYAAAVVLMTAFPAVFAGIFGIRDLALARACRFPFFCFSLYFMGYCFECAYTNVFQMMGYVKEKIFFIVAFSVVVAIFIKAGSFVSTDWMWLGLPAGAVVVVGASLLFAYSKHRRNRALTPLTLQYRKPGSVRISCSARYDDESAEVLFDKIGRFAEICELSEANKARLLECCRKLVSNIRSNGTVRKNDYFDFKMSWTPDGLTVTTKNAGSPGNPAQNLGIDAEYRYGYSMNITRFRWPLG